MKRLIYDILLPKRNYSRRSIIGLIKGIRQGDAKIIGYQEFPDELDAMWIRVKVRADLEEAFKGQLNSYAYTVMKVVKTGDKRKTL